MRLGIPSRIVAGFVVVLVAFSGIVTVGLLQQRQVHDRLRVLHEGYLPLALTLGTAKATQSVYADLMGRLADQRQPGVARGWVRAAAGVRPMTLKSAYAGVDVAELLTTDPEVASVLRQVRGDLNAIDEVYKELDAGYASLFDALQAAQVAEVETGSDEERLMRELERQERQAGELYQRAWSVLQQEISRFSAAAAQQQRRGMMVLGALALFGLLMGAAVTWWSQRVLRPIPLLHRRVQAVARGNLAATDVHISRDDELGEFLHEFESMVGALALRERELRVAVSAHDALRGKQQQIVDALAVGVAVVDHARCITAFNPAAARLLGIATGSEGTKLEATAVGRKSRRLLDVVDSVLVTRTSSKLSAESIPGFTEAIVDVLVTPIDDYQASTSPGSGVGGGALLVIDDISDEISTKFRMIHTERLAAIGRMAAHVTHEVRNPLSSIGLNFDLLRDELVGDNPSARRLIDSIQTELDRLERITEEYLRLARLPEPQLSVIDPGALLQSVVEFLRPEMNDAGVSIDLEIDRRLPELAIDTDQIRTALANLLRNARESMPNGGQVRVEARRFEDGIRVDVHDTGFGINDDEIDHIFDLFYTTKERGTGLGLPLTQQIVAAHHGRIECKRRHPSGTTFSMWLPGTDATSI